MNRLNIVLLGLSTLWSTAWLSAAEQQTRAAGHVNYGRPYESPTHPAFIALPPGAVEPDDRVPREAGGADGARRRQPPVPALLGVVLHLRSSSSSFSCIRWIQPSQSGGDLSTMRLGHWK